MWGLGAGFETPKAASDGPTARISRGVRGDPTGYPTWIPVGGQGGGVPGQTKPRIWLPPGGSVIKIDMLTTLVCCASLRGPANPRRVMVRTAISFLMVASP